MPVLTWNELEASARQAFDIWTSGSDYEWAKSTWNLLARSGFCTYEDERERHVVIGRYLALASIYRDWCSVAFEETQEDVPGYWIEDLDVSPFHLGQIMGDEYLSDDPEEAIWDAWSVLLNRERHAVVVALKNAYGGQIEGLFVALWHSVRSFDESIESEGEEDASDRYDVLNHATPEAMAGYAWIRQGCPNTRP